MLRWPHSSASVIDGGAAGTAGTTARRARAFEAGARLRAAGIGAGTAVGAGPDSLDARAAVVGLVLLLVAAYLASRSARSASTLLMRSS